MKKLLISLGAVSIFGVCSCSFTLGISSSNEEKDSSKDSSTTSNVSSSTLEEDKTQEELYEEIFNPTSKVEINLDFTNQAIYKLAKYSSDEYKKEMYHPCKMEVNLNGRIYTFDEVGARMKGNSSRNENFVDENGKFSAPIHLKLSLKQTFDDSSDNDYYVRSWENKEERSKRKNRLFANQQKFDLKWNKESDLTFTKQIYAYDAFTNEGIFAQHVNLVKVNIKSESDTLTQTYQLMETIDKDFLKKRLSKDEAKGNLYKSTYTNMGPASLTKDSISKIGVESPNYHPSYDLKTNDKEPNHSILESLINTINDDKSAPDAFKATLDSLIEVDQILKYQAMCWVMGNPDDSRNNSNNYYIYFNSKTNKMSFIPYDFDRCLGILKDWEIHMEKIPYNYTHQELGSSSKEQPNPLLWRLIIEDENSSKSRLYPVIKEYKERYESYCISFANKYLDVDKFNAFSNQFHLSSSNKDNANNLSFSQYAKAKLSTIK